MKLYAEEKSYIEECIARGKAGVIIAGRKAFVEPRKDDDLIFFSLYGSAEEMSESEVTSEVFQRDFQPVINAAKDMGYR